MMSHSDTVFKKPRLTLVGAGPGDPELITLKGVKVLKEADVILYDSLANESFLDYAPAHCLKIYVGKRQGCESIKQEAINELIVKHALEHGHVVRLKGGDPFVFARGHEELEIAEKNGIEAAVVPGISSSIALPELEGIPLTVRGINESFWVTTATLRDGELSNDIKIAAGSSATMIVMMGLHKLERIQELYASYGKENIPVAVIQNGSLPDKKIVTGPMHNIRSRVQQAGIGSPSLIVIGEVVKEMHGYMP